MANAASKTVSIFFIGANLIKIHTPTKRQVEPAAASRMTALETATSVNCRGRLAAPQALPETKLTDEQVLLPISALALAPPLEQGTIGPHIPIGLHLLPDAYTHLSTSVHRRVEWILEWTDYVSAHKKTGYVSSVI